MATALVQVRVDADLKEGVDSVLASNGLDIPTAIRMYFAKIAQVGGIPFEVRTFSAETLAALEEAERVSADPEARTYATFADLVADLDADDDWKGYNIRDSQMRE